MDTNQINTNCQIFEQYEVVPRPQKIDGGKYDGLLKNIKDLEDGKALKISLEKNGLTIKKARNILYGLRSLAKKKFEYYLGGSIRGQELYLWRNPN